MSKSNFPNIENAVRCERPDQDFPTPDPEKTEYACGIESDDFKPYHDVEWDESDIENCRDVPCMADDESVIMQNTPDD